MQSIHNSIFYFFKHQFAKSQQMSYQLSFKHKTVGGSNALSSSLLYSFVYSIYCVFTPLQACLLMQLFAVNNVTLSFLVVITLFYQCIMLALFLKYVGVGRQISYPRWYETLARSKATAGLNQKVECTQRGPLTGLLALVILALVCLLQPLYNQLRYCTETCSVDNSSSYYLYDLLYLFL